MILHLQRHYYPSILIQYAASDRLGILHFYLPSETNTTQIDTIITQPKSLKYITFSAANTIIPLYKTIHHRAIPSKTVITLPSKTLQSKPPERTPPKPMLKTTIPEPTSDVSKDITSLMKAFLKSFGSILNIPRHYSIRTDSSIKPVQHAHRKVSIEL